MSKRKIQLNENTIVLEYTDKSALFGTTRRRKLYPEDIEYITIETCVEKVLFNNYISEKIVIKSNRIANKITYYGIKEFEHFEDYKNGLRIFARSNNITLRDMVKL